MSTSFDANWDPQRRWEGIAPMLAATDIYFPNEREAALITGREDPWRQPTHWWPWPRTPAATRPPGRSSWPSSSGLRAPWRCAVAEALRLPADRVPVVDTAGAGDAFDAGFIRAFLDGRPLAEMLAMGVACGTLSTRAVGGVDGQATLAETEALL